MASFAGSTEKRKKEESRIRWKPSKTARAHAIALKGTIQTLAIMQKRPACALLERQSSPIRNTIKAAQAPIPVRNRNDCRRGMGIVFFAVLAAMERVRWSGIPDPAIRIHAVANAYADMRFPNSLGANTRAHIAVIATEAPFETMEPMVRTMVLLVSRVFFMSTL